MDRHDVFVSYNSQDKDAALEPDGQLQTRGFRPWIDARDAVPGMPWLAQLERIIESTPAVLVLVGVSGLGPWETEEMAAVLDQAVERKVSVVPVFLKGALPEASPKSLPLFLGARVGVDLRTESLDRLVNLLGQAVTPQRTAKDPQALARVFGPGDRCGSGAAFSIGRRLCVRSRGGHGH